MSDLYDLLVIGGGSAGYAAARTASGEGLNVGVVEAGPDVGGLCILRGCMPTKALLQSAEVAHIVSKSKVWGIDIPEFTVDFPAVMARKDFLIDDFAGYRREQLLNGDKFKFIKEHASFIDPHSVRLSSGKILKAKNFLISTGSKISPSPLGSLMNIGYITSDDALKLKKLPSSIIVLGGGVIAVEMAQYFHRLGVKTTVIQRSEDILKEYDTDVSKTLREAFEDEGIEVITRTRIEGAELSGTGKKIIFDQDGKRKYVEAEEILFALGRSPNTSSLNLEAAGVEHVNGRINVIPTQQTSQPHIYAAGDCCGPFEVVHLAIQQGETAANNIVDSSKLNKMDYRLITQIVFTDPQVAQVGLNEKQAKKQGVPYKVASYPFNDHGKSMILDTKHGFVKMLANSESGEIIGAACVGPMGGELIHEIIVAMHSKLSVREFITIPHYHPTLAEIWTYPAEDLADEINKT